MIYIAERDGYIAGEHRISVTDKMITFKEYKDFYSNFKFYSHYHRFREIHEICLEAHFDLQQFLSSRNLNTILREKKVDNTKVLRTGNKLILSYCTAMKLLVEKVESYLTHNNPEMKNDFKEFCSNLYDKHFAYRFL